ncbi:MAG: DNA-formamidopyrimidine glycosylase family protein [Antricoccus sp.]
MPEGHTLHRIASQYQRRFAGAITRSTSPQGRFATESAVLDGRVMTAAEAYGKHLFCHFDDLTVHVHLGLLGKIAFTNGIPPEPVGALRWRLHRPDDGGNTADLRGPTACEILDPIQVDTILARLGPDPLRSESDPLISWKRISRSRAPIAALLMDQSIAAGVGNIYRAELLYRHRVDPMMEGRLLRKSEWLAMWADLVELMHDGVAKGRIDTVRDEHSPSAQGRAARTDRHGGEVYVYRRAGAQCLVCQARVRMADLGGRNLFWCPRCQRTTRRRPKL